MAYDLGGKDYLTLKLFLFFGVLLFTTGSSPIVIAEGMLLAWHTIS